MKIALISDVHSNRQALKAVIDDMLEVERILCAGDIVGYGAEPDEVIEILKKKRVQAVIGDHDKAVISKDTSKLNNVASAAAEWTIKNISGGSLRYLKEMPEKLEMSIEGQSFLVVHGSPTDFFMGKVLKEDPVPELAKTFRNVAADVVVLGHTHVPMNRMIFGKLVINPGSVGQPRDRDPKASYAILDFGKKLEIELKRVEYDVERTAKAIKGKGLPDELAARLSFGW